MADQRASDADREAVVDQLRRHAADGRLDLDELEERTSAALAARTLAELGPLTADLPPRRPRVRRPDLRPEVRAYIGVQALLVAIWALTGMGYFWPVWPMLGWGIPLFICGRAGAARAGHCSSGTSGAARA
jgi:DUF1707 SHOCT-like domain/2TM domain